VKAYAFDLEISGRPVCDGPLNEDGSLCSTVAAEATLSEEQVKRLASIFTSEKTFGSTSGCFLPHHGFVFFDAVGGPVGYVSFCLLCDNVISRPQLSKAKLEGGYYGLSKEGHEALKSLCQELGLPKCDAKRPDEFHPGK
jgi:hypothetical protein